jgi:oxygen-independent coproporphyrinogen-3 oxidase
MVNALLREIENRKNELFKPIETIYFGGGTPSVLTEKELNNILNSLYKHYDCSQVKEITFEANPEDLSTNYLKMLKKAGINRLSIGTQSFVDEELQIMNREHTAKEAVTVINSIQDIGFNNFTVDIIYAVNNNYKKNLNHNLKIFEQFEIPHFSAYALTIEEKTLLHNKIKKGEFNVLPDDAYEYCFLTLHSYANDHGFLHYELSNYAKPGFKSIHNSNYWQNKPYLGFGPSAHSFNGKNIRRWNVANNHLYVKNIQNNISYFEQETLTLENQFNEYLMTKLRTVEGIDFNFLSKHFPDKYILHVKNRIKMVDKLWYNLNDSHLNLTPQGWLMSDFILKQLFI